ncbi:unnamed protein product [marine sediment metagenome]|uniref:Uncharacterized protein n=1 Tax=marine sediment metagenome TaxID=412755 RepID=X1RC20_9ZZZZ
MFKKVMIVLKTKRKIIKFVESGKSREKIPQNIKADPNPINIF